MEIVFPLQIFATQKTSTQHQLQPRRQHAHYFCVCPTWCNFFFFFFFSFELTVHKDCRNSIKWNIFPNDMTEEFLSSCFMSALKLRGASRTPGDTVWRKMRSFFLQNRAFFSPPFSRPTPRRDGGRLGGDQEGVAAFRRSERVKQSLRVMKSERVVGIRSPRGRIAEKMQIFSLCLELLERNIDGRIRLPKPPPHPPTP